MKLANNIAQWSKDPSTKVGAVIVNSDNKPKSFGFNGFARGSDDSEALYMDKEYKHRHVIHAESNAIFNAETSLKGCIIFITHPPCQHCAGSIVQSGISEVYCIYPDDRFEKRWNLNDTKKVLKDGGVKLNFINQEEIK